MKSASPAELRQQLKSLDLFEDDDSDLTILDRSTLESWATCPAQARFLESKTVHTPSFEMSSGTEVHGAISRTIAHLIDANGEASPAELRDTLMAELRDTRPDLQPDCLAGCAASAYSISYLLAELHPANILRFDGGEPYGKCGQLAMDFPSLGVRATSEIDLLYSGPSPDVLHEIDWKSGQKIYTTDMVKDSFQFQMHAALVFANYPDVQAVETSIFNTRVNKRTYRILFERKRLDDYTSRIRKAIGVRNSCLNVKQPATWPEVYKCSICPCAAICPAADEIVAGKIEEHLAKLVATEARAAALKTMLANFVDSTGGVDIRAAGVGFGRNKPASTRRKSAELYEFTESQD